MAQGLGTFLRYFAVLAGLLALNYDFCKDIVGSYLHEKPNTEIKHIKLYYFDVQGRGELARLILNYAGVPFEDFRFNEEEWPAIKPNMPFGQVPVLEVDGKLLAQSHSIARFLARNYGLAGQNEWEQSLADMYVDCIYDLQGEMGSAAWESDPIKQREMFDLVISQKILPHLIKIEEQLEKNGSGYLVGHTLTWADIAYYTFFTSPIMNRLGADVLKTNAPNLQKLVETVGKVPNIKKYVEARPVTIG